jgi:type IV secretory pathway VirB2 component (pilin)
MMSTLRRGWRWLLLAITAIAAFALVFLPAWIIQPFRPQSARGVAFSYALRTISPIATIIALLIVAGMIFTLWRGARWWSRIIVVIFLLLTTLSTWFARQNHFEWMFHPLAGAAYSHTDAATFVDAADLVLAVERNGEAAAYPIRQLAYHHLVQDDVGGVPIVVTY